MENDNKNLQKDIVSEVNEELQEHDDVQKSKYAVATVRDKELLKTFVKFYNRVKHPRVTAYNLIVGGTLIALPFAQDGIRQPGVTICYVAGTIMVLLALFRQYISVYMMKSKPETKYNTTVTYLFGNTGVQILEDGEVSRLGNYKKIYCIWEDEKNFYIGMNEDDLVVLPKRCFEQGDVTTFREFVLDKSRAEFRWKPAEIKNIVKDTMMKKMFHRDETKENEK